jgi:ubiquinone/menaquinone biosynthesis C-methylase UbiE
MNEHGVHDALHQEYHHMASWYDNFWASYLNATLLLPLQLIQQAIKTTKTTSPVTIVDVGCGTGEFLTRLEKSNSSSSNTILVGVEPSNQMLEQAYQKSSTIKWLNGPAESLPLENSSSNIICSTNAFHFFRDKKTALKEMDRVLIDSSSSNSSLGIITDWCADYWLVKCYHLIELLWWNGFKRYKERYPGPLTSKEIQQLVEDAGFVNVKVEKYRLRVFTFLFWGMQTITFNKKIKK